MPGKVTPLVVEASGLRTSLWTTGSSSQSLTEIQLNRQGRGERGNDGVGRPR